MLRKLLKKLLKYIFEIVFFPILLFPFIYRVSDNGKHYIIFCSLLNSLLISIIFILSLKILEYRKGSLFDCKTGIKGCKYFNIELDRRILSKRPFSLFYIDLDKFKSINDAYGHNIGDCFLKEFTILIEIVLPKEATLYRLGGDEFAIIAKNVFTQKQKMEIIDLLNNVDSSKIKIEENELELNFSIGVSTYPTDSMYGKELKQQADMAMYEAKRSKFRNYMMYEENFHNIG